jgi:hypothetical protein
MRFTVTCSFLQIYQEAVYDLLAVSLPSSTTGRNRGGLRIRWSKAKEFYVENLYEFECQTVCVLSLLPESAVLAGRRSPGLLHAGRQQARGGGAQAERRVESLALHLHAAPDGRGRAGARHLRGLSYHARCRCVAHAHR